ncbi:MAG: DnaJ domain-containing protein [Oscillospiraceae bacterium]|jgi:hypothetical protein|nr:DnaJ domain-containing protein [Oscillospiraceae bacterium]
MTQYYATLEIPVGASKEDVNAAYHRLAKVYHPDLNPGNSSAEEKMKKINDAYTMLTGSQRAFNRNLGQSTAANGKEEERKASAVMTDYFTAIRSGDHIRAYSYISDFDKQYVTIQSFREWRESVARLFRVDSFRVVFSEDVPRLTLRKGMNANGKKLTISISEQNRLSGEVERFHTAKYCIRENGEWRVLLGYRDLNEIARVFENLSAKYEAGDMQKYWEEYCSNTCRELGILSKTGLVKEAEKEIYRAKRLKHPMFAAVFLMTLEPSSEARLLVRAADTIRATIRITDVCAYLGGGVFAVLYAGLKKRNAVSVTNRLKSRLEILAPSDCRFGQFAEKADFEPLIKKMLA